MANDGGGSPHDLVVQTWTMYSIAMVLVLLRTFTRFQRFGLRWQLEDYMMLAAVAFYTAFAVTNIAIIEGGGSTLYTAAEYATFTAADIRERIKGSKIEFASENCMLCTMYTLKASMLILYYRLTSNLNQQRLVLACAGYTFCGWLVTELVLFLNCHPFTGYFTIPPPQQECATYFRYEVTQCVFNISSDLAILAVILPLLLRTRMPWRTKLPVILIFSLGIFVIACAAVSKYFTFHDIYDYSYQFWYLRESSIGMYIANLPFVWTLVRQAVSQLQSTRTGGASEANRFSAAPSKANTAAHYWGDVGSEEHLRMDDLQIRRTTEVVIEASSTI
ncbi:hypothetical protein ASPZODRAFT_72646 [Penicilliopsis zonata CBS 506.65]|uniref:Rhodopsin domain-containing protein n=1 Tax=Penicilliopsis zonata CBS 506.65 TaxID=1073090 RepID=A0A1L9S9W0_9EURO|nr:hypothetical protein ASPZODRAFT_72646 [Penicilliopsis zonata CBS 506.65]OJJ43916.1 hypothetical protein ASPZODRAFT_72646 [Penicilliopsis zonata CBS 506.65]